MTTTALEDTKILRLPLVPQQLYFAAGLPPFVDARTYRLHVEEDAPAFLRMECIDTELAFVLIDPFAVSGQYRPEFSDKDIEELELQSADKPLVLAIVNLSRGVREATVNLAGPLLINPKNGKGKQVVLVNAAQYSVRQSLT